MIYRDLCGEKVSLLGFGTMRLPILANGEIDEKTFFVMTDMAIAAGVNYFDTAYPYHGGKSELAVGKALARYPRESYFLANKYPGHQYMDEYDPAEIFEEQLSKCGVEYFDFYLLHNVYENSLPVYLDKRWGIIEYFCEQKRLGRIKHLGFSTHARPETLEKFLGLAGDNMEFCQIQLNFADWTLQNAKRKAELLNERNIPIVVMEPVRGGRLCDLPKEREAQLKALRPNDSIASHGFRFVQDISGVSLVLSGMSNKAQMEDNIKTFSDIDPVSEEEKALLFEIGAEITKGVPCTACRYCVDGCPLSLDIPLFMSVYNEISYAPTTNATMVLDALDDGKYPTACLSCGSCAHLCPQLIDIPTAIASLNEKLSGITKWAEVCRKRAEEAAAIRAAKNGK